MRKIFLSLFALLLSVSSLLAQRTCGSYTHLQDQLAADPQIQINRQQIENQTAAFAANPHNMGMRSVVTIPVVVHVVWNASAENIPDAQIYAQINELNLDYAKLNPDASSIPSVWNSTAVNTNIQFCLAVRDPSGVATTGIERRQTTVTSWSTNNNVKHYANGGLDAWPAASYLNLWVCNLGSGLLGYAQFPGGSAATDGVVVLYSSVGSIASPFPGGAPYDLGRTATHEGGHWLNLNHIWGDDGGACSGSDNVGDTPNQASENYGCPTFPLTDACTAASPGVMFMDYMDYTDDACMYMFTAGQSTRMNALFGTSGARVSLLSSLGCTPVVLPACSSVTAGTISASATLLCGGGTANLSLNGNTTGVSGISYLWQQSLNGTTGWVAATGIDSNDNYTTPALAGQIWYRCVLTCTPSSVTATTPAILISAVGISSVTNDTVCIAGNYDLIANGYGNIVWYSDAAGINIIHTGDTLNMTVANDTIVWVDASSGGSNYNTTPTSNSIGTSSNNTTFTNGETFRAYSNFTIDTVFAYPGSAGTIHVNLIDSATGSVLSTATRAVTAAQVGQKVPIPTAFNCTAGTTYNMDASGSTTATGLQRNSAGAVYPYTVAGILSIVHAINNSAGRYYFFYDWRLHTGCSSGLTPVYMHVGPLAITTSAPQTTICNGNSATLSATGATTYSWMPGGMSGSSISVSPTGTTTYTVTGTVNAGCSGTDTIMITVIAPPNVGINSANDTICTGGHAILNATGGSTYSWMPGASTSTSINVTPTSTTTYTVTGSNGACTSTATFTVNVHTASVTASIQAPSDTLCKGNSLSISATGLSNYNWNPGGMTGSTISVSPIVTTTYTVSGTDAFGCDATTTITVVVVDCNNILEAASAGEIKLFPNPASTEIVLSLSGLKGGHYEVELMNLIGQKVFATAIELQSASFWLPISLKQLSDGVYFIRLSGNGEKWNGRIVKE